MIDYDEIASNYSKHRDIHPKVLEGLISSENIKKGSNVLEVGCGTGNYITAICQTVGASSYGIDPSEEMLKKARARTGEVLFKKEKAENLDFEDCFDLIFSVDVIHHLDSPSQYFEKAYESLNKDGKICTVTDSEWIIENREPLSKYFPETIEADLERYPKIDELKTCMAEVGFTEIQGNVVEQTKQITDLQAYREKTFSVLHLITDEAYEEGITRMKKDLMKGPIRRISRYFLLWGTKK
ncbi:hypothetical protein AKJ65_00010 [candidate division MSBL1 archaeon SCGC-AAA259E19]|uniref:Methyltransferase type 11 domain-containing protein n=1 Tax=candidate division MSBL1 archaeon SCGC-AAA259E19 TaxID=1698264 RepID=A0A133UNS2_9EURY|nr:hypothetical protein AKJ65_00010 [candidate division MSBL1 archaeon SCGC-AAA259E19]